MTKEQYLVARIDEINAILDKRGLSAKYRKNQRHALMFYTLDLERERAFRESDENR